MSVITRLRKSEIAFACVFRLISSSRVSWRILMHSSYELCFFKCTTSTTFLLRLARRRRERAASSYVHTRVIVGRDQVHLTSCTRGSKDVVGDRWQNGAQQGQQKSAAMNYDSHLARERHVHISDLTKRGLVCLQLARVTN